MARMRPPSGPRRAAIGRVAAVVALVAVVTILAISRPTDQRGPVDADPVDADPVEHEDGGSEVHEPAAGDFVEVFDGNAGLDRFRSGVFHRDVDGAGFALGEAGERTWAGDHAPAPQAHDHEHQEGDADDCGPPETPRELDKADRGSAVYVCREHLMTSMGDVDFYSIVWFSPDAVFDDQDTVAWEVNSTYLGERQWVEVMIAGADDPDLTCAEGLPCDVDPYPPDAVVIGIGGPWGSGVKVDGSNEHTTWQPLCGGEYALDPEGCGSKRIRRPWSLTDHRDGTMTLRFIDHEWVVPGGFPEAPWKVVFKDHNYTPDKDGAVAGHTWHWDDIAVINSSGAG